MTPVPMAGNVRLLPNVPERDMAKSSPIERDMSELKTVDSDPTRKLVEQAAAARSARAADHRTSSAGPGVPLSETP